MRFFIALFILFSFSSVTVGKTVTVSAETSSSGYSLSINEVHDVQNQLYILAKITPPSRNMVTLSVLSTVSDSVTIESESSTENIFILYPQFSRESTGNITYISTRKLFDAAVLDASKLDLNKKGETQHAQQIR